MEAVIPYFGCMRFRYTPRRKKSKKNSANRQLSLLLEIKSALISVKFSNFGSQKTKRKLTRALMENPEGDSKLREGTVGYKEWNFSSILLPNFIIESSCTEILL